MDETFLDGETKRVAKTFLARKIRTEEGKAGKIEERRGEERRRASFSRREKEGNGSGETMEKVGG